MLTGAPFGFNAILGLIGLAGILMRNTLILVDQIELEQQRGLTGHDAVTEATVRRARPVLLTALAAPADDPTPPVALEVADTEVAAWAVVWAFAAPPAPDATPRPPAPPVASVEAVKAPAPVMVRLAIPVPPFAPWLPPIPEPPTPPVANS